MMGGLREGRKGPYQSQMERFDALYPRVSRVRCAGVPRAQPEEEYLLHSLLPRLISCSWETQA